MHGTLRNVAQQYLHAKCPQMIQKKQYPAYVMSGERSMKLFESFIRSQKTVSELNVALEKTGNFPQNKAASRLPVLGG